MMAGTGLIVITNPAHLARANLTKLLALASNRISQRVYVKFEPELKTLWPRTYRQQWTLNTFNLRCVGGLINRVYISALQECNALDVRVIVGNLKARDEATSSSLSLSSGVHTKAPIELVFFDSAFSSDEMLGYVRHYVPNRSTECTFASLSGIAPEAEADGRDGVGPAWAELPDLDQRASGSDCDKFKLERIEDHCCVGGTFDRLHTGHKVLLSQAVILSRRRLTVGVSDGDMIKSKKLKELIEPCLDRMQHVRDFLEDIDPSLTYSVVPIQDPFGPTKDDPTMDALIVSEETLRGGAMVNSYRKERGLMELQLHCVGLVGEENRESMEEELKVSSSTRRMRLLGSRIREPKPPTTLPYVIGLTGGICSGKSSIAKRLEKLGASVVDCDALGHATYLPGSDCHEKIVAAFGEDIVNNHTGMIDRKKLGARVFSDPAALKRLTDIVWPEIRAEVVRLIAKQRDAGSDVVVLDAAVLVEAGWTDLCNEVWVSIIPEAETIRRIQERDGLSVEEAKKCLSSQISNERRIEKSHIVLSSFWAPEYTQSQVEKAWGIVKRAIAPLRRAQQNLLKQQHQDLSSEPK